MTGRKRYGTTAAIVVAVLAMLLAHGTVANAITINRCLARKLSNVGASVALRARCYSKHAGNPDALPVASCLDKARTKFTGNGNPGRGALDMPEQHPPCVTTGDQNAFDAAIASYVDALDAQVGNSGEANRCDAKKLTCVGKYVTGVARCLSRASTSTGEIDGECTAKAALKLSDGDRGCLDKAEAPGNSCSVTGDIDALRASADQFVIDALCALDPSGTPGCPNAPLPTATPEAPAATPTPRPTSGASDPVQLCVDKINQLRASIGRPPYARWTEAEMCVDDQAANDGRTGTPHDAFGQCDEWAQDECPGWNGPPSAMITQCLQQMWNEGPGPFAQHGHYINMSSTSYTKVACGFAVLSNGAVWATQDFQ